MNNTLRFIWLPPLALALAWGAFWLWRDPNAKPPEVFNGLSQIEPGIDWSTIEHQGKHPWRMFTVYIDLREGWRLRPVLSDGGAGEAGAALRRTPVSSQLAAYNRTRKSNAPVAVNGGFFAYEGGAVGAVKLDEQWIRLPWKNRTAIGFYKNGRARIANLKATARVVFGNGTTVPVTALNGFPVKNGVTVLTRHFAATYKLKVDETALDIGAGRVRVTTSKTGAKVSLARTATNSFVLVANGTARALVEKTPLQESARFEVITTPNDWHKYHTILGAGPRLVKNGQVNCTEVEEEFRPDVTQRGPRTAIGILEDGSFFLVVVESGVQNDTGLTLPELARKMRERGAVMAINLDGGASVALVVNGKVITPQAAEVPVANSIVVTWH